MPRFPPDPDEVFLQLRGIVRPPPPPWLVGRWKEEAEARREQLGLPEPFPRKRKRVSYGSRMVWPYRVTWEQSASGRGTITVLKEERSIGRVSYVDVDERMKLVRLLESIVRGGGKR